jgi:hypothetical protein
MVWKHKGIVAAFADADPAIREAAARIGADTHAYRLMVNEAFNPVAEQIVTNPHDARLADVERLRVPLPNSWYVAYTDFDGWLMIYEVEGDTTTVRKIGRWEDPEVQVILFGERPPRT